MGRHAQELYGGKSKIFFKDPSGHIWSTLDLVWSSLVTFLTNHLSVIFEWSYKINTNLKQWNCFELFRIDLYIILNEQIQRNMAFFYIY